MNQVIIDIDIPGLGNEFGLGAGALRGDRLGVDMGMFHGLGLGIDGLPNPLLDPLFMRPPPGVLDPNGLFMNNILGIPGGDPYMGGRALPGGADRPGQPPNALENSLFNHYQRNQVQVQTNLNDELGQQLLETMDVQFEEVKEPEVQPLA